MSLSITHDGSLTLLEFDHGKANDMGRDRLDEFDALGREDSPRQVAARRSIKVSTLQSRRPGGDAEAADS